MRAHSVAKLFPLLQGAEFEQLVEDIRLHGQREPIWVTPDRKILDGRNRYRALKKLQREPKTRIYRGDDFTSFVVSLNLTRRHLTESQRAMVAARVAQLERGRPKNRSIDLFTTQPAAATSLKVSVPSVKRAKQVLEFGTPELVDAVDRGVLAVSAAATLTKEKPSAQKRVVQLVESGMASNVSVAKRRVLQDSIRRSARRDTSSPGLIRDLHRVRNKFRTIYADPPWPYQDQGVRGSAASHYPTLTMDELKALPVSEISHPEGAHLWLWTTFPMIRTGETHQLLEAWGFDWAGEIVWDKDAMGTGHYIRSQVEVLVLGVRGKLPVLKNDQSSLFREKRTEHSKKPAHFYDVIERLSPGPRIELFARSRRKDWSRWGLEA